MLLDLLRYPGTEPRSGGKRLLNLQQSVDLLPTLPFNPALITSMQVSIHCPLILGRKHPIQRQRHQESHIRVISHLAPYSWYTQAQVLWRLIRTPNPHFGTGSFRGSRSF